MNDSGEMPREVEEAWAREMAEAHAERVRADAEAIGLVVEQETPIPLIRAAALCGVGHRILRRLARAGKLQLYGTEGKHLVMLSEARRAVVVQPKAHSAPRGEPVGGVRRRARRRSRFAQLVDAQAG